MKKYPDKTNFRVSRLVLAHSLNLPVYHHGKSREREYEAASHSTSTVKGREQANAGLLASARFTFFLFIQSRTKTQGMFPLTFRPSLPILVNTSRAVLHRWAQRPA